MTGRWPLERVLFAPAGTMVALSVMLTMTVSRLFLVLRRAGVAPRCQR
jgi:hypothetical protein